MAKTRNYCATSSVSGMESVEPTSDRDAIVSENQALRQLIAEIRLQCDLLRERLPPKISYH